MADTIKRKPKNHECIFETEIRDMHKIITGNGEPDKSLINRVALIGERQSNVIQKLDEISTSITRISDKHDGLLSEITEVRSGLATFKAGINGKERTLKELEDQKAIEKKDKHDKIIRWLMLTGLIITSILGFINFRFNKVNVKQGEEILVKQEVADSIINPRGTHYYIGSEVKPITPLPMDKVNAIDSILELNGWFDTIK